MEGIVLALTLLLDPDWVEDYADFDRLPPTEIAERFWLLGNKYVQCVESEIALGGGTTEFLLSPHLEAAQFCRGFWLEAAWAVYPNGCWDRRRQGLRAARMMAGPHRWATGDLYPIWPPP